MLFSKRQALVDEFVMWCDDADKKLKGCKIDRGAFGVVCFLDSKGVLLEKPNSSKVDSTSANSQQQLKAEIHSNNICDYCEMDFDSPDCNASECHHDYPSGFVGRKLSAFSETLQETPAR